MRQVNITFSGAHMEPSAEYSKIVRASEKAASNIHYMVESRMCSPTSFKVLCSNYEKIKDAAERVFKKSVSKGVDNAKATKEYQRALWAINDALNEPLALYASEVVEKRGYEVEKIGKDMKKGVYAGHLPGSGYVSKLIGDIKGVGEELDKSGISSRSASSSVASNIKKAEKIREQLERYSSKTSKYA